jgi:AraC family transcriptional regulator, ethanolamine operon transcriptional activator
MGRVQGLRTTRYRQIVEKIDLLLQINPAAEMGISELARMTGISRRTLHNAVKFFCGLSPHRYVRVRRIWMVRNKLRSGAAGLTVKSSAHAHGFHHMGEFTDAYKATVGERPSKTLADGRATRSIQINQANVEHCSRRFPFLALGSMPDTRMIQEGRQ